MIPVFKKGWLGNKVTLLVTSPMGMRRGRMHNGFDFGIPVGTKLFAPIGGKIVNRKIQRGGAGLYIVLRFETNSEYYTIYFMHLHTANVSIGQTVNAGDLLGTTGGSPSDRPNCGVSTGPHLHFEIRRQGTVPVNPLQFLAEKCVLQKNGRIMWAGRAASSVVESSDLHSISEYSSTDITSLSNLNACEKDTKKVKNRVVSGIEERLAPGIWQIVKLLMDSSVANRQIFDSSISMQTGSLLNFFNKVCQKPLVEFTGDTYGDQYYFMVRRPPYDKEGIKKMQDLTFINIEDSDIRSTNLTWKSDGIYSWYQMIPFSEYAEMTQINLYMPAIFFPEYAAVWGSRDLTVQNQYVNYFQSGAANKGVDNTKEMNGDNIIRNAIRDLKYLIESNAYNPFVRQGTITLRGDRRIKRGTLIMMPNSEQFYVDSVSNSLSFGASSVDRTTTLNVSHGMMSEYIDGIEVNNKNVSYFNIIDFGLKKGQTFEDYLSKLKMEDWKREVSKWKVNLDVFSYFLKRSQMLK